jgi:hypothetical protein
MKTKHASIVAGIFILFLSGCIPSIHKLYHEKDLLFKGELLGNWEDDNSDWIFEANAEQNGYKLTYIEDRTFKTQVVQIGKRKYKLTLLEDQTIFADSGTRSEFDVHLVKLGGSYFIDLYPGDNDHLELGSLLTVTLFPVHIFAKVEFLDQKVLIRFFDPGWLEDLLEEGRIQIAHEDIEDGFVLSASTDELQKFVTKYANTDEAFLDAEVLRKKKKTGDLFD